MNDGLTPEQFATLAKNAHRGFYVHPDTLAELRRALANLETKEAEALRLFPMFPDPMCPPGSLVPVSEKLPIYYYRPERSC